MNESWRIVDSGELSWDFDLGCPHDMGQELRDTSECQAKNRTQHMSPKDLHSLASDYRERFIHLGDLDDMNKAIEYATLALHKTPESDLDYSDRHSTLAMFYHDRFNRLGKLDDLEKAIDCGERTIDLTSDDFVDFPLRLSNLGEYYNTRFQHLGELGDLEKSIKYGTRAIDHASNGNRNLLRCLSELGYAYSDRFWRMGNLEDIERAIDLQSRALALAPDGDPHLPSIMSVLAASHSSRYNQLGELDDLDKDIDLSTRALALTPDGHSDLPGRMIDLAISYRNRFKHLGKMKDLEMAIEYGTRTLNLTPNDHLRLNSRLGWLGAFYSERSKHLGGVDDLNKAIELESLALQLTPDGHSDHRERLYALGVSCRSRFERLGEVKDLEQAIGYLAPVVALAVTPNEHPDLPRAHFALAKALFLYSQRTGNLTRLDDALHSFRKASQLLTAPPREVFEHAFEWAKLASKHPTLNCIEAYRTTIDLLPRFIWLGATTNQRYQDLLTAESLATSAAYAAILSSDHRLALEWLEHARGVVWSQTLMLRSPLDQLRSSHPDLADRLQQVANQLHDTGSHPSRPRKQLAGPDQSEQASQQRRRLAKEYSNLLDEAHTLPGFEDFLAPMKADRLVQAARHGPVVVVNCHEDRCDALFIMPGESDVKHLSLPDFSEEKARHARSELIGSLRRKGLRQRGIRVLARPEYKYKDGMPGVLLNVWNGVVRPILDFLGYTNSNPTDELPHITWCPTGALSFLPLHAAGDYDKPRSRVFDYAISSYTSTLTALLASDPTSAVRSSRVLGIGQAQTPGLNPLPGTTTELSLLQAHTQNKVEYTQLTDDQATTAAVLDAMENHDWVHLACHAHQNVEDPTQSGFFLHDGTLDLASINQRSFKNKGLAFLSACQTATGDERLPDEAVHLASGMTMAGYPSVIATMWSVVDEDAPFVADKVYAELMKKGVVGNGEAGRALHDAVGKLRDQVGEKEFARWVPYIHIGS